MGVEQHITGTQLTNHSNQTSKENIVK